MIKPQDSLVGPTGPCQPIATGADRQRQGDDRSLGLDVFSGANLQTPPYHPPGRHAFAAQDAAARDAADGEDTLPEYGSHAATCGGGGAVSEARSGGEQGPADAGDNQRGGGGVEDTQSEDGSQVVGEGAADGRPSAGEDAGGMGEQGRRRRRQENKYYKWNTAVGEKTREDILSESMKELGIDIKSITRITKDLVGVLMCKLREKMGEAEKPDDDCLRRKLLKMGKAQEGDDGPHRGAAKPAARPQQQRLMQEQPPEAPNPKRTRNAGGPPGAAGEVQPGAGGDARAPTGVLRSLIDAVDQDQERQAQVAPESDQPPGPSAQNPSARQGSGGVGIGGGGGGSVLENDDWLLLIAARIALTAPSARQRFTDLEQRHKGAAADAKAAADGVSARVNLAADAAYETLEQLCQRADGVINDFKASLRQLTRLSKSERPETVRAMKDLTVAMESDVIALEELRDQLTVDIAPDELGRLQQFNQTLTQPVQELLRLRKAYQDVEKELHTAETKRDKAGALLEQVCGVVEAAKEVAAPADDLPDLPLLSSWSAGYVLEHLSMQESAVIFGEANTMPHLEVVANLVKLQQRSNLWPPGGAQQQLASRGFREEVDKYISWAAKDWAKKARGA